MSIINLNTRDMENMTAMNFEILIRRAFNCDRYGKKGADADIYRSLQSRAYLAKEKLKDSAAQSLLEDSIVEVRNYIEQALIKAIERLPDSNGKGASSIRDILTQVQSSTSEEDLSRLVRLGLDTLVDLDIGFN
jgi:hypothetical protein